MQLPHGVRHEVDGSFWITKSNPQVEALMDANYTRIKGELRWVPKEIYDLKDLKDKHIEAELAYFVGKGPSLDLLKKEHFAALQPIFCINDSIRKIETLGLTNPMYVVQQDWYLREKCVPKDPNVIHFVNQPSKRVTGNEKARAYLPALFHCRPNSLTIEVAIAIASLMGIHKGYFMAFDSCVTKNVEYAKVIGYPSAHNNLRPQRFLSHKKHIEDQVKMYNLNAFWHWFTKGQEVSLLAFDTLSQS